MEGFKNHYIDGKQWDRSSNLQDEISEFTADWKIDNKENKVLKKILDYNKRRNREKLIIQNTTKEQLEFLAQIPGLKFEILEKINSILGNEMQYVGNINNGLEYDGVDRGNETNIIFKNYYDLKNEAIQLGRNKIKKLQRKLNTKIDGYFGPKTFAKYKRKNPNWETDSISDFINNIGRKHAHETDNSKSNLNEKNRLTEKSKFKNNKEYVKEVIPRRWHSIANEFISKLSPKERLSIKTPLLLVDKRRKRMLYVLNGNYGELPVILGANGFKTRYVEGDKKTIINKVHRFNNIKLAKNLKQYHIRGKVHYNLLPADNAQWKNLYYDKNIGSYRGDKLVKGVWKHNKRVTVVGASIRSDLSDNSGGRYFHLVSEGRNATWGCIGVKYSSREKFKQIARAVQTRGGFGYVT